MNSDDTTDAVAEARATLITGTLSPKFRENLEALIARIDDLEAKLAAVTRERDAAERTSRMQYDRVTEWQAICAAQKRTLDAVRATADEMATSDHCSWKDAHRWAALLRDALAEQPKDVPHE